MLAARPIFEAELRQQERVQTKFIRLLARCRARCPPPLLRRACVAACLQRWSAVLRVAAAKACASTLLSLPLHGATDVDGQPPELSDLLHADFFSEAFPSRLSARTQPQLACRRPSLPCPPWTSVDCLGLQCVALDLVLAPGTAQRRLQEGPMEKNRNTRNQRRIKQFRHRWIRACSCILPCRTVPRAVFCGAARCRVVATGGY